ncbi:MAG: RNA polymerase sigma factor [Anaerolineales bacterium]|nr:RNA polymerase sigma factor [Anaerolineales bacterium]
MTETDWIAQARRGEAAAWAALVDAHQAAAFRLAYLLLGDPADAADVAQDAFLRAWRALDRFDARRPFRPWLLRITANLARNRRRALGRYWAALQRHWRAEPEHGVEVQALSAQQAEAQELWRAVRRLSAADQQLIYLRYFLELSEAETAAVLEVPAGTVKSRLHRALGRLRQVVFHEFPALRPEVVDE